MSNVRRAEKTFLERWIEGLKMDKAKVIVKFEPSGQVGETTKGAILWPGAAEIIKIFPTGRVPSKFDEFAYSKYGKRVYDFWNQAMPKDAHQAQIQAVETLRIGYHYMRWLEEGTRVYQVDPNTALALTYTKLDDILTDQVNFPVDAFYTVIPEELGWKISVAAFAGDPEPVQPLVGIMCSVQRKEDGSIDGLHMLFCGRSSKGLILDSYQWAMLGFAPGATLGDVMDQPLIDVEGVERELGLATARDAEFNAELIKHTFLKFFFGSVLYVTSAHPKLYAMPPLEVPKGNPSTPKHAKKHKQYKNASQASICYVGGLSESFVSEKLRTGPKEVTDLKKAPPRPHIRQGHMRWQHHGPNNSLVKHVWIKPTEVGDWDRRLTWETVSGLVIARRKARPAQVPTQPVLEIDAIRPDPNSNALAT